jgi:hypothetical protein
MRDTKIFFLCSLLGSLAVLLFSASTTYAQSAAVSSSSSTNESTAGAETPRAPEVTSEEVLPKQTAPTEDRLIAQAYVYGRMHGSPMRGPRGTYGPGFGAPPPFSPAGALIGLGLGAALGAAGHRDGTPGGRVASGLVGGGLGALIGGVIGGGASQFHARAQRNEWHRRHHWRAEGPDEEASLVRLSPPRQSPGIEKRRWFGWWPLNMLRAG